MEETTARVGVLVTAAPHRNSLRAHVTCDTKLSVWCQFPWRTDRQVVEGKQLTRLLLAPA